MGCKTLGPVSDTEVRWHEEPTSVLLKSVTVNNSVSACELPVGSSPLSTLHPKLLGIV